MGLSDSLRTEKSAFAIESDYAECARLHRQFGTTYYFASRRLPLEMRRRVDAVYGFVRVPDEWVDNPNDTEPERIRARLQAYRQELLAAGYGISPKEPVLRAFADTVSACEIPLEEPLVFLDAMEADIDKTRYSNYEELKVYMRGSAAAVGLMLIYVLGADRDEVTKDAAVALGEAMQLTNFLRDVGEDWDRGRVYIPQTELVQFGVSESDIAGKVVTDAFRNLAEFSVNRARQLFRESDASIALLPADAKNGVMLARVLYEKILDKIEENQYDVFNKRARTTPQEKMAAAWNVWSKGGKS
jgi:phytoene synthase